MNQQIKEKRKQPIRTCLHQPFEYNFKTLDQYKSLELAKKIQEIKNNPELKQYINIAVGIRSAIRKLRTSNYNFLALILIMDQSITEILIQASTVFWKYKQQIILAKEETRTQLQKFFKINKLNCIYLFHNKDIEIPEEIQLKIQEINNQMDEYRNESKCEIPIILGDDIKYQTVKLKVPKDQEEQRINVQKQQNSGQKVQKKEQKQMNKTIDNAILQQ